MLDGTRHLFALPRGRGPSQTPPSLATDSSISPGPPSPWLPALSTNAASQPPRHPWVPLTPAELATPGASPPRRVLRRQVEPVPSGFKSRGCKGRSPLHKITFSPPFPAGEGGRGDRGQKESKRQGRQATRKARPPPGTPAAGRASAAKGAVPPAPRRGRTALRAPQRQRHAAPRRKTSPYHLTHNIKNDRIYAQIQANHKRKKENTGNK